MNDNSLMQDFIIETGEHLDDTERNLLRLEQHAGDTDLLNEIFRSIHTIKGSAEYLGMEKIAELSHKLESLLDLLRRGKRKVEKEVFDALIGANDRIGALVEDLSRHQVEKASIDDVAQKIDFCLAGDENLNRDEQKNADTQLESENEQYEDDFDEELFGIFTDKLLKGFKSLQKEFLRLTRGPNFEAQLERCLAHFNTLKTSANYMGYDNLKVYLDNCIKGLYDVREDVSANKEPEMENFLNDVLVENFEKVKDLFPGIKELQKIGFNLSYCDDVGNSKPANKASEGDLFASDTGSANADFDPNSQDLMQEFIAETEEHLEEVERSLLRLEQQSDDMEILNAIFRSIHTIKGSSEYLGMDKIAELSHQLEGLLDLLRRGELKINESMMDLLIGSNDRIGQLVDDLYQYQAEKCEIADLIQKIEICKRQEPRDDYAIEQMSPVQEEENDGAPDQGFEQELYEDEHEDEYDDELFDIFYGQLKTGIRNIKDSLEEISNGSVSESQLDNLDDQINTLKSSANYMGYEKLKGLYERCLNAISSARDQMQSGITPNTDLLIQQIVVDTINKVKQLFPDVSELQDTDEDGPETIGLDDSEEKDAILSIEKSEVINLETGSDTLLKDFVIETRDHLDSLEDNLSRLKQQPSDSQILNEVFRSIHTIKGSSEYLGIEKIAKLTNKLELLIELLRQEKIEIEPDTLNLFLDSCNFIDHLLEEVIEFGAEKSGADDLIKRIDISIQDVRPEGKKQYEHLKSNEDESDTANDKCPSSEVYKVAKICSEQYDKELFSVFMAHLNDRIGSLNSLVDQLRQNEDFAVVLEKCHEDLNRLRSAANYMEYYDLVGFIDEWVDQIDAAYKRSVNGESFEIEAFEFNVMRNNIEKIRMFFDDSSIGEEYLQKEGKEGDADGFEDKDLLSTLENTFDEKIESISAAQEEEEDLFFYYENDPFSEGSLDTSQTINEPLLGRDGYKQDIDAEPYETFFRSEETDDSESLFDDAIPDDSTQPAGGGEKNILERACREYENESESELNKQSGDVSKVEYEEDDDIIELVNIEKAGKKAIEKQEYIAGQVQISEEDDKEFDSDENKEKKQTDDICDDICKDVKEVESPEGTESASRSTDELMGVMGVDKGEEVSDEESSEEFDEEFDEESSTVESRQTIDLKPLADKNAEIKASDLDRDEKIPAEKIESRDVTSSIVTGKEFRNNVNQKPLIEIDSVAERTSMRGSPSERGGQYQFGQRRKTDKLSGRLKKQSIRVDSNKIDYLINQVGELVVNRAGFNQILNEMRDLQNYLKQSGKLDKSDMKQVKYLTNRIGDTTLSLGRVTAGLQESVMTVRMLPIAQLFSRYPRLVHDLVRTTNKKVKLEIHGEETELDKMVIEQIYDPLVHIIRNSVDHGIEDLAQRKKKGKPETGTLNLDAYHESNYVVIEISDDGKGIDIEKIKSQAIEKQFVTPEELAEMNEREILTLIMKPGFSTAKAVTHTSGRGVGMDVVKEHIERLNGTIDIFNTTGNGVRFRIRIPLTLAIIPALMIKVAGEIFAIPLATVDETVRVRKKEVSTIEGFEVFYLREEAIPLIRLTRILKMSETEKASGDMFVVVVNTGVKKVGFIVDQLKGREEIVIKPLEDYLQEKSGFSGATILGDGSISLILDVFELVSLSIDQHTNKSQAAAV
ncbi:MAG: hypothetical protein GY874_17655 [Desulfobacteraceae bacterium]|nr:hypothetical protein [Desulfobacteraceae bacterium]